jgi:cell pole-organizing protein PopZ
MEDILASIRRILNEDEAPPGPGADAAGQAHQSHAPPAHPPSDVHDEGDDGVLVLDEAMLVSESEPPPALSVVKMEMGPDPAHAISDPPLEPEPAPPLPPPIPPPPLPSPAPGAGLMAPESTAAAAASVGSLLRTLSKERTTQVHRGGPTIEDLVREEIRPLLKDWLDQHLPPLVERLVRLEIERVAGRAGL